MKERGTEATRGTSPDGRKTQPLYVSRPSNEMGTHPTGSTMSETFTNADRDSLIQMFLDATDGETYGDGRLITRSTGEHTTELIAYGWNKIAEYNESIDTVTVHAGHAGNVSQTVTRYVNLVREIGAKRRTTRVNTLADSAPNVSGNIPSDSTQFIGNYKDYEGSDSSLDEWARSTVDADVKAKAAALL